MNRCGCLRVIVRLISIFTAIGRDTLALDTCLIRFAVLVGDASHTLERLRIAQCAFGTLQRFTRLGSVLTFTVDAHRLWWTLDAITRVTFDTRTIDTGLRRRALGIIRAAWQLNAHAALARLALIAILVNLAFRHAAAVDTSGRRLTWTSLIAFKLGAKDNETVWTTTRETRLPAAALSAY